MDSNRSAMVAEVDPVESKPAWDKNMAAEVDSQEEEEDVFTLMVLDNYSEEASGFAAEDSSEEEVRPDRFLDPQIRDAWNARYACYFGHFEDTTKMPKKPRRKLTVEEEGPRSQVETKPSDKMGGFTKMVAKVDPEEESGSTKMVAEDSEEELGPDRIYAAQASRFRDEWNAIYSRHFGHFEDTTKIPNMRFTYKKPKRHEFPEPTATLQIYSLKVAKIWGGLQWPLHVFGKVAVRDVVDHNRNMIFHRPRESCQILTQEDPYLKLTGPTRAVVLVDPVTFEVDLQVKGVTQDKDESLSFLAVTYNDFTSLWSRLITMDYASKLSKVEFELGSVVMSVEATISLRLRAGSWPSDFRARFSARTASISKAEVILLDCGDEVRVSRNGIISLSRCVASVEILGKLEVSVKAVRGEEIQVGKKSFKPQKDGASHRILNLGFCALDVTVAWSRFSSCL